MEALTVTGAASARAGHTTRILAALTLLLMAAFAQAAEPPRFARVEWVEGTVTILDAKGGSRAAKVGGDILPGETIRSAKGSEMHVRTEDAGFIAFRQESEVRIDAYLATGSKDDQIALALLKGALRSITGWLARSDPARYRIRTPTATVGVRGTDHEPAYVPPVDTGGAAPPVPPGTYDKVNAGSTVITNAAGSVSIAANQTGHAAHDGKLAPRLLDRTPPIFRPGNNESRIEARKMELAREIETRLRERAQDGKDLPDADKLKDLREKLDKADKADKVDPAEVRRKAAERRKRAGER